MTVNFAVDVISGKEFQAMTSTKRMGQRYEYIATRKDTSGKEFHIFAEKDFQLSLIAIPINEIDLSF